MVVSRCSKPQWIENSTWYFILKSLQKNFLKKEAGVGCPKVPGFHNS